MRLFRKTYKDRKGDVQESPRFYVELRDAKGRVRRLAAFTDRAASAELGRKIERLVALKVAGAEPEPSLTRWIEDLSAHYRDALAEIGILDAQRIEAGRVLGELIADFETSLRGRNRTAKHVTRTVKSVCRVVEGCAFRVLSDIDAARVEHFLHILRVTPRPAKVKQKKKTAKESDEPVRPLRGLSTKASNDILAAAKQFTRWTVQRGLASRDPLAPARPVRVERVRERRALTVDEVRKLIQKAHDGPKHLEMSGPLRAMTYRLAAESGLRVSELQALRVADFDLNPLAPTVTVRAETAKNRREAQLPLRVETAAALEPFLRDRLPLAPALPLPRAFRDKSRRWLSFDLNRADIPFEDEAGKIADFHSLRSSFVSSLIRAGVNARVVQTLARHATPSMTLGIYARLRPDDERRGLESLASIAPGSTPAPAESLKATGTEGTTVWASGGAERIAGTRTPSQPQAHGAERQPTHSGMGMQVTAASDTAERVRFPPPPPNPTDESSDLVATCEATGVLDPPRLGVPQGVPLTVDPLLAKVLTRWPALSPEVQRAVLVLIGA